MTTLYSSLGYISIQWTNVDIDPDFVSWRVYRRQTDPLTAWVLLYETAVDSSNYEYRDWTAPVGYPMEYAVVQVADRFDEEVESDYTASDVVTPESTDYWLIHPTDETKNLLLHVNSESFKRNREQAVINIIGRGRKVEFGTDLGYSGSISARIRRDHTAMSLREQRAALEALQADMVAFHLRNPFGDVWQVVAGDIPFERVAGVGSEEMLDITIDFQEIF